jgi:hypothetical protein
LGYHTPVREPEFIDMDLKYPSFADTKTAHDPSGGLLAVPFLVPTLPVPVSLQKKKRKQRQVHASVFKPFVSFDSTDVAVRDLRRIFERRQRLAGTTS